MAVDRRGLWLGGILIVAIVAAIVVRSMDDTATTSARPGATPRPRAAERTADAAGAAGAETPAAVNLQALAHARGEPADQGRNPFRFRPKVLPPPPPMSQVERPTNQTGGLVVPAGPPPPPPIALKFIGIVQKVDGTRIAVLSDGRRPIHGVEGQEIEGQYRILKIGVESIELVYLDGRGRQTIRLTGQ